MWTTLGSSALVPAQGFAKISEQLTVHEEEEAQHVGSFIGLHVGGRSGFVSIAPKRLRKSKCAIDELLSNQFCSGHTLQLLVGHCTWAMMARREGLSILYQLVAGRDPKENLWLHPHSTLVDQFALAQKMLNLEHLNSCLYTRGRWGLYTSRKRYIKLARLQTELAKVPIEARQFGMNILADLPSILSKMISTPAAPSGIAKSPSGCSRKQKLPRPL